MLFLKTKTSTSAQRAQRNPLCAQQPGTARFIFPDRIAAATEMIWSLESRREFAAIVDAECPDIVHVHNTFMAISPFDLFGVFSAKYSRCTNTPQFPAALPCGQLFP